MDNPRLEAALQYAERGWRVLALGANSKIPVTSKRLQPNGSLSASIDPEHIKELWEQYPNANVGIATGEESGLTVIDVDSEDALATIYLKAGKPETYTVKTPRGVHFYLPHAPSLKQTAGFIEHVDIRNEGGYVVAPPSEVNGTLYKIDPDGDSHLHHWEGVLALALTNAKPAEGTLRATHTDSPTWVTDLIDHGSGEGVRNDDAARLVGYFRKKNLPQDIVLRTLQPWAERCQPPFQREELEKVIAGIWRNYIPTAPLSYQDTAVSAPLINISTPRRRVLSFIDEGVVISADRIRQVKDGVTVWFRVKIAGIGQIYGPRRINLLSDSTMDGAKRALKRRAEKDWDGILESVASHIVDEIDNPGELIDVSKHTPTSTSQWVFEPFLRASNPTLFYGDGGEGKSTLAAAVLLSVATGISLLPGCTVHTSGPVLYLDWESDADSFTKTIEALARGAGITIPAGMILYRRMSGSLEAYLDVVQRDVHEHNVIAVVTDSLVALASGDATESEAARIYFNAIRSLNIAVLGITHTTKETDGKPYGSVFYWNYARAVWLVQKDQETGTNSSQIGVYHKKANNGELQNSYGAEVVFGQDDIVYSKASIQTSPKLAANTGVKEQVAHVLRNTPKTIADIHLELPKITEATIRTTLSRHPQSFLRLGGTGQWMLARNVTPVNPIARDSMGRAVEEAKAEPW